MWRRAGILGVVPVVLGACGGSDTLLATPRAITLSPASVQFGALTSTRQITAVVLDEVGRPIPGVPVSWSSDDGAIAAVDSGAVRFV